jgi:hypothetical protein
MKIKYLALIGFAVCVTPLAFAQQSSIAGSSGARSFARFHLSGVCGQSVVRDCGLAFPTGSLCVTNPYQTSITVRTENGRYVTTIQTDAQGRFRTGLRPGSYTLTPYVRTITSPTGGVGVGFPYASPVQVVVPKGRFIPVTIVYSGAGGIF